LITRIKEFNLLQKEWRNRFDNIDMKTFEKRIKDFVGTDLYKKSLMNQFGPTEKTN